VFTVKFIKYLKVAIVKNDQWFKFSKN